MPKSGVSEAAADGGPKMQLIAVAVGSRPGSSGRPTWRPNEERACRCRQQRDHVSRRKEVNVRTKTRKLLFTHGQGSIALKVAGPQGGDGLIRRSQPDVEQQS
jgi:hypothetical protein